jgi:DNA primase
MIPEEKVNEVRDRAGILEIVSDYVVLRKSGANYQGLCPFHGEKTPSFNVNPGRGIFHCFGCGVGGNVFSFVMRMEGLAFPDAVRFLARRVGVEIEERPLSADEARRKTEREQLFEINGLAADFYRAQLLSDPAAAKARQYLERRGVRPETSETYRLGYAVGSRDALVRHLERKRVPLELAERLGIVRQGERGGWLDLFRNRLIFVIADPQGRVCGFGGRVLDDGLPKYINSPESPIYRKSEVLFGADLAKGAMRELGAAIVVEGYFDQLGLYQAGVRNVVATCGTALTPGHVKLLSRYAQRCYLLFDGDKAGQKATFRAMELCFQENFPARVITLPEGEDPDSFVTGQGAEAFAGAQERSVPVFEYYLDVVLQQAGQGLDGRVRVAGEIAQTLAKVANPIERELCEREAAKRLGIDRAVLRGGRGPSASPPPSPSSQPQARSRPPVAGPEEMLATLMARYPDIRRQVEDFGPERLFGPQLQPVAVALLKESGVVDDARLLELASDPETRSRLAALLIDDGKLADIDADKAYRQCCASLAREGLKDMKSMVRQLAGLDPESPQYRQLLEEIDLLRNRKSKLS